MIRIAITAEAYEAIEWTLALGTPAERLIRTSEAKDDQRWKLSCQHRQLAGFDHPFTAYSRSGRKASEFKDLRGRESCLHRLQPAVAIPPDF